MNADGSLDPSFAQDGTFTYPVPGAAAVSAGPVLVQASGRVVVLASRTEAAATQMLAFGFLP